MWRSAYSDLNNSKKFEELNIRPVIKTETSSNSSNGSGGGGTAGRNVKKAEKDQ